MAKPTRGGQKGHAERKTASELTDDERRAIEWYVSGDGMWINQYLRGRGDFGELSEFEKEMLKNLDSATDREIGERVLYRSVDAAAIFGSMSDEDYSNLSRYMNYGPDAWGKGAYAKSISDRMAAILNGAKGKTITEKGFTSTTTDYEVARDWGDFSGSNRPIVLEIHTGKGTRGVDASFTDRNASSAQREMLLARGQKMTVSDISVRDRTIYVKVRFN